MKMGSWMVSGLRIQGGQIRCTYGTNALSQRVPSLCNGGRRESHIFLWAPPMCRGPTPEPNQDIGIPRQLLGQSASSHEDKQMLVTPRIEDGLYVCISRRRLPIATKRNTYLQRQLILAVLPLSTLVLAN